MAIFVLTEPMPQGHKLHITQSIHVGLNNVMKFCSISIPVGTKIGMLSTIYPLTCTTFWSIQPAEPKKDANNELKLPQKPIQNLMKTHKTLEPFDGMEDFPEDLMGVMRLVSDMWFRSSMGFDILAMLRHPYFSVTRVLNVIVYWPRDAMWYASFD